MSSQCLPLVCTAWRLCACGPRGYIGRGVYLNCGTVMAPWSLRVISYNKWRNTPGGPLNPTKITTNPRKRSPGTPFLRQLDIWRTAVPWQRKRWELLKNHFQYVYGSLRSSELVWSTRVMCLGCLGPHAPETTPAPSASPPPKAVVHAAKDSTNRTLPSKRVDPPAVVLPDPHLGHADTRWPGGRNIAGG